MAIEPRLTQQTSQKLLLSPQMKLYLQLLTLPVLELKTRIENEMIENPSLEEDLKDTPEGETNDKETSTSEEDAKFDQTVEMLTIEPSEESMNPNPDEIRSTQKKIDFRQSLLTNTTTLNDYLIWQLGFLDLSDEETEIAKTLIGNINDEGYLTTTLEETATLLSKKLSQVEKILQTLQTLDPPGVAARNLQETLQIQLNRHTTHKQEVKIAAEIIEKYFNELLKKHLDVISKKMRLPIEKIQSACELIGKLEPKPGRIFNTGQSSIIIPDAIITFDENEPNQYKVEILNEYIPKLRISSEFRKLLKDKTADSETKDYVRNKIKSAMLLLQAVQQRQGTLERIVRTICRAQVEFLEKGFAYLKPLRMKDIADDVGIHESTVSRAIAGKYVQTPQGTIPIKSFFSTKLATEGGGSESQKSILEKIRNLIDREDPKKPLTDTKIASLLQQDGTKVARRTVAKYREELKILPGHLRRR